MRGTKAKKLRRAVYDDDHDPKERQYTKFASGQIIADMRRRLYQRLKREI